MGTTMPVPAAASTAVAGVLDGPERIGQVLATFPAAIHVATGAAHVPLVCLVTVDAVRLPCSLVVRALPSAAVGDRVVLGHGRLVICGVEVLPARWWKPAQPRLHDLRHARLRAAALPADPAEPVRGVLADGAAGGLLAESLAETLAGLVPALLGLGPGLTPAGDDVLAGGLVALRAAADPAADRLAAAVGAADPVARTTAVSAALLTHAARGECVPELADLLAALDGRAGLLDALDRLLAVGGSTGRALAAGVRLALCGTAPLERRT